MRIQAALEALPPLIPEIVTYRCGSDVGAHGATNMHFGIVSTFDSIEGWRAYDAHSAHDSARTEIIRPWIAERTAIQFES